MDGLLFKKLPKNSCSSEPHGGYASATMSARLEGGEILVPGRGDLRARDVGLKLWPAKHPDVDHRGSKAGVLNPVTEKREFFRLGIKSSNQRNGLANHRANSPATRRVRGSGTRPWREEVLRGPAANRPQSVSTVPSLCSRWSGRYRRECGSSRRR